MNVAIIGAGVAGLAAAYELTKAGHAVTIYEAGANAGGLASGFKPDEWDWSLERFYHHLFTSDHDILNLAQEIGIGDKVFFRRPVTALWYKEKPYAFDSPFAQFLFPGLSLIDKFHSAPAVAYLKLTRNWQSLEKVTAYEWVRKWMGERVYKALWEPMLIGKFGEENYRTVNMAWLWARIYKRSTKLGYFVGGFQAFSDALAAKVEQQGAQILYRAPIRSLTPTEKGGMTVVAAAPAGAPVAAPAGNPSIAGAVPSVDGEIRHDYDTVIATIAPRLLAKMAPGLPESYLAGLRNLKSMGAVVLIAALDRRVTDGFYWISLPDNVNFPFLAMVEHTNFVEPEHYAGDHLVYMGDYLPPDHRYFQMSQAELEDLFLPELKRFNPAFDRSWVRRTWLFREPYAQPVVPVDYSRMIPSMETPVPGLFFASMSQVYPWDRGTNYAVEIGQKVARLVMEKYLNKGIS